MNQRSEWLIGITGHPLLAREEEIAAAIRSILLEIQDWNPRTQEILTVISPLAEGADRIMANQVLKVPGGRLQALLPMDRDAYARDFADERSREEYRRLLDAAWEVQVLVEGVPRELAYEAVGHAVVDRSDIMIAIWDGDPGRGKGGTAAMVAYARSQGKPLFVINSENPREIRRERLPIGRQAQARTAEDEAPAGYLQELEVMGDLGPELARSIRAQGDPSDPQLVRELARRLRLVVNHFGPRYGSASLTAQDFQDKYRRTSRAVFILAALSVLIVATQSVFGLSHWIIAGEFGAISVILSMTFFGNRRGWHTSWLENRLEAEWLRHGMFVAFLSGQTTPGIERHWACRWVAEAGGVRRVRDVWQQRTSRPTPESSSIWICTTATCS